MKPGTAIRLKAWSITLAAVEDAVDLAFTEIGKHPNPSRDEIRGIVRDRVMVALSGIYQWERE